MIPLSMMVDTTDRTPPGFRSNTMTNPSRNRFASIRAFILAIGLLLASVLATGTAAAGPLNPAYEVGAPGGSGGIATQPDDLASSTIPGIRVS